MAKRNYYQEINAISFPSKFENYKQDLLLIALQIEECATILENKTQHIPSALQSKFVPILSEFTQIINSITLLRNSSNSADWDSAKNEFQTFILDFYQINDSGHSALSGSFYVCQSIINIVKFMDSAKDEVDESVKKLNELQEKSSVLLETLQKKAGEEVATNYAAMFLQDAKDLKKAANGWLVCIILLVGLFVIFLIFEEKIIPLSESTITTIITLSYFRRLLIISFMVFIITFVIKQYNVKMHLYTQNKHRSNTLSSYKLFIQSMGDSDAEARSQLMREVSKSIYDAGHSGYLNLKDDNESSSNTIINEVTKVIKGGADK